MRRPLQWLLPLALFAACCWLLWDSLRALDLAALHAAIGRVSPGQVAIAAIATAASYGSLAVLEGLLFATAGLSLRWQRLLFGSFVSNSVSASVGLVMASSALLRLRFYGRWAVAARDTLYVSMALFPVILMAGMLAVGVALLSCLEPAQRLLPIGSAALAGVALLLALPAALFVALASERTLSWRAWRVVIPSRRRRLALLAAGMGDWVSASLVLFTLTGLTITAYPLFLVQFVFGWLVGAASGLPAGTGVVDAATIRSFGNDTNVAQLAAALLLFRLIYFAVPALTALTLLAFAEWRHR